MEDSGSKLACKNPVSPTWGPGPHLEDALDEAAAQHALLAGGPPGPPPKPSLSCAASKASRPSPANP